METADSQLLTRYAQQHDNEAFALLVRRHIDFVYAASFRQTQNAHAAQDITQAVFLLLSQKAASIKPGTVMKGWLFNTTRFVAADFRRSETRRKNREREAAAMRPQTHDMLDPEIASHLDDALALLSETDRQVLLLRFFEDLPLAAVGQTMRISEDAAKKRLARAIERVRLVLEGRGATVASTSLAMLLSASASQAAPAHLAQATVQLICGSAVNTAASSAMPLAKGAAKMMSRYKLKLIIIKAALGTAFATAAAAAVVVQHPAPAPAPVIQPLAVAPENSDDKQLIFDACTGLFQSMIDAADHNDMAAILALYYFDPKMNPLQAHLGKVNIEATLASYHLQKAALTRFGPQAMSINLHCETTAAFITDVLARVGPNSLTISGDTAILTPAEAIPPGHWPVAPIYFKQINGDWKLDYDRTFTVEFRATRRQPVSGLTEEQDLADTAKLIDNAWDELAADIEQGKVANPAEVQRRVNAIFAKVFSIYSDLSISQRPR